MSLAKDQHAVQELAAQGADQAFAGRVHARRLDRGEQNPAPVARKTASNEAVKFEPRSRIRNRLFSKGSEDQARDPVGHCAPSARSAGQMRAKTSRMLSTVQPPSAAASSI